jgi:antitoxin CptB
MSQSSASLRAQEISKLRWRCRRGMLENDLLITRYLDENEALLSEVDIAALYELMQLSDNELWDVLSGRIGCPESRLQSVVDALQAIRLSSS